MTKLKSMTAYVMEKEETSTFDTEQLDWYDKEVDKLNKIRNYAKFLSMPLELKMFVPVDDDGNVLKKPKENDHWTSEGFGGYSTSIKELDKYQKAKSEVIFEGWKFDGKVKYIIDKDFNSIYFDSEKTKYYNGKDVFELTTIEYLVKLNLTLTT